MREIGIQFSAPMVRAVLDGSKTVTRRTVKGEIPAEAQDALFAKLQVNKPAAWRWRESWLATVGKPFRCPYGVPGDRLWVREAWRTTWSHDELPPRDIPVGAPVAFYADGEAADGGTAGKFRPGMFMPRWASRILLEVTDVRVERLQDISEEQALAEGVLPDEASDWGARDSYSALWESLNGEGAWSLNPWVFAITFRRITP